MSCHNLGMGQGGQAGGPGSSRPPQESAQPRTIGLSTHEGLSWRGFAEEGLGPWGCSGKAHSLAGPGHNSDVLSLHTPGTPRCPQTRRITQLHAEPHCPSWPATGLRLFPAWVLLLPRFHWTEEQRTTPQNMEDILTRGPCSLVPCASLFWVLGPPEGTVSAS